MTSERELREALAAMTLRAETAEAYLQQTENELAETQKNLKFIQEMVAKMEKRAGKGDPFPMNKLEPFQREAMKKMFPPEPRDLSDLEAELLRALTGTGKDDAWERLMAELLAPKKSPTGRSLMMDRAGTAPDKTMAILRLKYGAMKDCIVGTVFVGGKAVADVHLPDRHPSERMAGDLAWELINVKITTLPKPELVRRIANAIEETRRSRGERGDYNVAL